MSTPTTGFRTGYVALAGPPNVGKSSLLNRLVGEKLSIVSHKPQTTRHRVMGIVTTDQFQAVFQDTPGYLVPDYLLQENMMAFARQSLADADVVLLMFDAAAPRLPDVMSVLVADLNRLNKPVLAVLNKQDTSDAKRMDRLTELIREAIPTVLAVLPVSAKTGEGTSQLMDALAPLLPEHPPLYPPDDLSTHQMRFFAEEMIREKIFLQFEKEIPYSSAVLVNAYTEREDGVDEISAEIIVERDSQKVILIGRKGEAIRNLGIAARRDIEQLTGRKVFLHLFVKVRKDWRKNRTFLKSYGYDPTS